MQEIKISEIKKVAVIVDPKGEATLTVKGIKYKSIIQLLTEDEIDNFESAFRADGYLVWLYDIKFNDMYGYATVDIHNNSELNALVSDLSYKVHSIVYDSLEVEPYGGCDTCGYGGEADFNIEYEGDIKVGYKEGDNV